VEKRDRVSVSHDRACGLIRLYGGARMAERLRSCSRVMLERAGDLRRKALNEMTKSAV